MYTHTHKYRVANPRGRGGLSSQNPGMLLRALVSPSSSHVLLCTPRMRCGACSTSVAPPRMFYQPPQASAPPDMAGTCSRSQRGTRGRPLPPFCSYLHPIFPSAGCILPGITYKVLRSKDLQERLFPPPVSSWVLRKSLPLGLCTNIRWFSAYRL